MARRTKEDAQGTRTSLLNAAEQVFCEKGVSNTTLNEVAKAAGMTRGAIYWHFRDKNHLLKTMFERALLPMDVMLDELKKASDVNPLQVLRTICVEALTTLAHSPKQQRVFGIMFHKCEQVGQLAEVFAGKNGAREECHALVQEILRKAVVGGHLPHDTNVLLAQQVIHNFMTGTMSEWLVAPQAFELDACAPAMVDMILAGLLTYPPRLSKPAL